jgi:hypothetical protein
MGSLTIVLPLQRSIFSLMLHVVAKPLDTSLSRPRHGQNGDKTTQSLSLTVPQATGAHLVACIELEPVLLLVVAAQRPRVRDPRAKQEVHIRRQDLQYDITEAIRPPSQSFHTEVGEWTGVLINTICSET